MFGGLWVFLVGDNFNFENSFLEMFLDVFQKLHKKSNCKIDFRQKVKGTVVCWRDPTPGPAYSGSTTSLGTCVFAKTKKPAPVPLHKTAKKYRKKRNCDFGPAFVFDSVW